MKLLDGYIAKFIKHTGGGNFTELDGPLRGDADGVIFTCPKCHAAGNPHAVICWFVGKVPDNIDPGPGRWSPEGEGLHDLTLQPSVWLKTGCEWHGRVTVGYAD